MTLQYLRGFVMEWFDQNPLGQVSPIKPLYRVDLS